MRCVQLIELSSVQEFNIFLQCYSVPHEESKKIVLAHFASYLSN